MDILIKNIGGLPEDGDLTLTITPKGQVILGNCIFTSNFGREVKAVALPEHGDLIDRDFLIKDSWASYMLKKKNDDSSRVQYDTLMGYEIRRLLEDAPTIVEASNGTDN